MISARQKLLFFVMVFGASFGEGSTQDLLARFCNEHGEVIVGKENIRSLRTLVKNPCFDAREFEGTVVICGGYLEGREWYDTKNPWFFFPQAQSLFLDWAEGGHLEMIPFFLPMLKQLKVLKISFPEGFLKENREFLPRVFETHRGLQEFYIKKGDSFVNIIERRLLLIDSLLTEDQEALLALVPGDKSPLRWAIENRRSDVYFAASHLDLDFNVILEDNLTLLHLACKHGCLEIGQDLIRRGLNINARGGPMERVSNRFTDYFNTPLFYACAHNHLELVQLLLSQKYLDRAFRGYHVLEAAVRSNNPEIITAVLKGGIRDSEYSGALKTALEERIDRDSLRAFLENCVVGDSPLIEVSRANHMDGVAVLLKRGADPNVPEKSYGDRVIGNPMANAIKNQNLPMVDLLLAYGGVLEPEYFEETILFNLIKPITSYSFEVETRKPKENSAFFKALLERGANPAKETPSIEGDTALHRRILYKSLPFFINLINQEYVEYVTVLLREYSDRININAGNPLIHALKKKNPVITALVLQHPQIRLNVVDENKMTPFMIASRSHSLEELELLIEAGKRRGEKKLLNLSDARGYTAFHHMLLSIASSVSSALPDMVRFFAREGIDISTGPDGKMTKDFLRDAIERLRAQIVTRKEKPYGVFASSNTENVKQNINILQKISEVLEHWCKVAI